jgi:mono/diheme cytochrome c family protein
VRWRPLAALVAASAVVAAGWAFAEHGDWTRGLNAAAKLENPTAPSSEAIARGRVIFRERCVTCHGDRGRGDGPAGVTLDPKPADLVLHVPQHTDGELYYMVSVGFPDSAMPEWRSVLSEQQRWELVHYVRVLASGNP